MGEQICITNIVIVISKDKQRVLMCLRSKNPYMGKLNFVGGKIMHGENYLQSAYRELYEETGIKQGDIDLKHLMNIDYIINKVELKIFYGILKYDVQLIEEVNRLFWIDLKEDFFDLIKYAGEGNIGHMIEQVLIDINNLTYPAE